MSGGKLRDHNRSTAYLLQFFTGKVSRAFSSQDSILGLIRHVTILSAGSILPRFTASSAKRCRLPFWETILGKSYGIRSRPAHKAPWRGGELRIHQ